MSQFNKSILVLHAHPDDTEAFSSGVLKLMKNRGYQITIATLTAGELGGIGTNQEETISRRSEEARKAAAVLDAEYYCLGGKDGYLYDTPELRTETIRLIRKVKAGIIITHLPMDYHSDHRATCNIAESAAMISSLPNVPCSEEPVATTPLLYHSAPLGFSNPLGERINAPHFALDITSVIETKMEMLQFHVSQIELMKSMHKIDNFFDEMKQYNINLGKLAKCQYAEIYWQHRGGGFQKDPLIQEELKAFIKPFNMDDERNLSP